MSRKKKYSIPLWKHNPKNSNSRDEKFVQLYHDLLMNKNFLKLSYTAKTIYLYMCDFAMGNQEFIFPYSIYSKITSRETFRKATNELIEKGFIVKNKMGKNTRTPNEYKFTSKWYQ